VSACGGNCTETIFPMCVGSCTVATNMTLPFPVPSNVTRPAMPGISGCTGGCTETTFPICTGSCVVAANMTMPHGKPGGPGGHHGKPGGMMGGR
jgi:hypothetical protein